LVLLVAAIACAQYATARTTPAVAVPLRVADERHDFEQGSNRTVHTRLLRDGEAGGADGIAHARARREFFLGAWFAQARIQRLQPPSVALERRG
jgi:hypothetical protein